jgi:hypothetical protein
MTAATAAYSSMHGAKGKNFHSCTGQKIDFSSVQLTEE